MTLDDIKKRADDAWVESLRYNVFSMPIEKQQAIAKKRGYEDFEKFVTDEIQKNFTCSK